MIQIEPRIYYEESYMGVTLGAIVLLNGVIIIDAPIRMEDARSWRSTLINQRGGPNRLLVCLDAHPDRTLGARAMECTILAHQKAAQVFRDRPTIFKGQNIESGAVWETYHDAIGMRWAYPDISFSNSMSLHWGESGVVLEHRPGPTPGAIWAIIPDSKVIFVGDAIVLNQPPFLAYADLDAWLENLDVLWAVYKDYVIVSGRGGPIERQDIREQQKFLRDVHRRMERIAKKNQPPEATQEFVGPLLSKLRIPHDLRELYSTRLQHGLYQCYASRYRSSNSISPIVPADGES